MADKLPEPEVTDEGVKVAVGDDQWIIFPTRGFTVEDEIYLSNISFPNAFAFIVDRCLDWKVKTLEGALVPFKREELQQGIAATRLGMRGRLPSIPVQSEPAFVDAIFVAMREIRKIPLGPK